MVEAVAEALVVVAVEGADQDGVDAGSVIGVDGADADSGVGHAGGGVGAVVEPPFGGGGVAAVGVVGDIAGVSEVEFAVAGLEGVDDHHGLGVADTKVDLGDEREVGVHVGGHVAAEDLDVGEVAGVGACGHAEVLNLAGVSVVGAG